MCVCVLMSVGVLMCVGLGVYRSGLIGFVCVYFGGLLCVCLRACMCACVCVSVLMVVCLCV